MASNELSRNEERIAKHSAENAELCLKQKNYGRAFAHYLLVLKLRPILKTKEKEREGFNLAFSEWTRELEESNRVEDLFKCYEQACQIFPECETMLNNMGTQLFRLGYVDEAASCFRRALKCDPGFLGAQANLENVCSHLVERWHFRMLNDVTRNQSYRCAIEKAVASGRNDVLDIGTGSGLLSMFAVDAGANSVIACEMSKTMYEMAADILAANEMAEKIHLIHKKSTDLEIPQDLSQRVSLVVTETVDAGLLGEHILTTLQHAWKYLLKTGVGQCQVIPAGATVYVCLIESETIRKQNRLLYPGLRDLDLSDLDLVCDSFGDPDEDGGEPYTTENLLYIKGGYKQLSSVVSLMEFDFNDPLSVEIHQSGVRFNSNISITQNGCLDAIALWFDLHLDKEIHLSTSPESNSCWEQAIYPVLPHHVAKGTSRGNLSVRAGDTVRVQCTCAQNCIQLKTTSITSCPTSQSSLQTSTHSYDVLKSNRPISSSSQVYLPGYSHFHFEPHDFNYRQETGSFTDFVLQHARNRSSQCHTVGFLDPRLSSQMQQTIYQNYHHTPLIGSREYLPPPSASQSISNISSTESNASSLFQAMPFAKSASSPVLHSTTQAETPLPMFGASESTVNHIVCTSKNETDTGNQCHNKLEQLHMDSECILNEMGEQTNRYAIQNHSKSLEDVTIDSAGKSKITYNSDDAIDSQPIINGNEAVHHSCPSLFENRHKLQRAEINRLNDIDFNTAYCRAFSAIQAKLVKQGLVSNINVVDITHGFSPFCLQALTMGAKEILMTGQSPQNQTIMQHIAVTNGIDVNLLNFMNGIQEDYALWDVLVTELVEPSGTLRPQVLEDIALARLTCLKSEGVVIPSRASVFGMCIESEKLREYSCVINNDKTLGFKVSEFINDFQMTTHVDIDLHTLPYKKLTQPFKLFDFNFNLPEGENRTAFLEQETTLYLHTIDEGKADAVVYWFDIDLAEHVKLCTLDVGRHWNQAAVVPALKNRLFFFANERMEVKSKCRNSCIGINLSRA